MRLALLCLTLHTLCWQWFGVAGSKGQYCDGVCKRSCDDEVGGAGSETSCPDSGQRTSLDFLGGFTGDYDEQTCVEIQSLCPGRVITLSGDFCRDTSSKFTVGISGVRSGDIAIVLSIFVNAQRLTVGRTVLGKSSTRLVDLEPFPFKEKTFQLRFTVGTRTIKIASYVTLENAWMDISTLDMAPSLDPSLPYQICRKGCGIVIDGSLDVVAGSGQRSTTPTTCTQAATLTPPAPTSDKSQDTCVDIGPLCTGRAVTLSVSFNNAVTRCTFKIDFKFGHNVAMRLQIGLDPHPGGNWVSAKSIVNGRSKNKGLLGGVGAYFPFESGETHNIDVLLDDYWFLIEVDGAAFDDFAFDRSIPIHSINRLCVSGCGNLHSVALGSAPCDLDNGDVGTTTGSWEEDLVKIGVIGQPETPTPRKESDTTVTSWIYPNTPTGGKAGQSDCVGPAPRNKVDISGCAEIGPLCTGKVIDVSGTYCAGAPSFTLTIRDSSNRENSPLTLYMTIKEPSGYNAVNIQRMVDGHTTSIKKDSKLRLLVMEGKAYAITFVISGIDILIYTRDSEGIDSCQVDVTITGDFPTANDYTLCVQDECNSLEKVDVYDMANTKYDTTNVECGFWRMGAQELGKGLLGGEEEYDQSDDSDSPNGLSEALRWANVTVTELTPGVTLTYVGLSLSITCLIVAVVLQFRNGTVKQTPGKIIVSLTLSLAAAQLVFMILDLPYGSDVACRIIAIIEHLLWLYAFSWSNVMVIDLVRVISNNTPTLHRTKSNCYLFYCGVSSVIPISIIIACILLDHFTEWFQYGYPGNCWISPDSARHYFFIMPIAVSVTLNITLLLVVFVLIRKIQQTIQALGDNSFMSNRRGALIGLKLASVMGITWVFGFLGDILNNDTLIFLFTVFNVFQGIMVFFGISYNHTYVTRWVKAKVCGNQSQPDVVTETTRTSSVNRGSLDVE